MRRLALILLMLSLLPVSFLQAQEESYENAEFGITFNLPAGWEVQTTIDTLLAGSPEALAALQAGTTPNELVLRVVTGSFVNLNITNATELPGELTKLVPSGVNASEPVAVTYGNSEGWETEYNVASSNLTTRVAILALPGGRVGLVRGMAASDQWEAVLPQFESLRDSMVFSLPTSLADPLAKIPDEDGGVIWQYQAEPPADAQPVTLGGVAYDPFQLLYAAAGERGILVLDQTTGAFVNYIGPYFDDDNIVDIAMSIDARIYVANATAGDNNHIMIVNRAGGFEYAFGFTGDAPGDFAPGMPHTIAVTRRNEIWTVSEGHTTAPENRLYQFDRFGNLLKMIDLDTINPELSKVKLDNNIDTSGLFLVGETGGLNLLDFDGAPLVTHLGLEVFAITTPTEIAVTPGDNILISTSSEGFLQFAPSGALLDRFGVPYDSTRTDRFQPGETLHPAGMVAGVDGTVYFAETNPTTGFSQVQAFTFSGDGNLAIPNRPNSGQGGNAGLDPEAGGGNIAYGETVQGALNNNRPSHDWYFEGKAGDKIRITMHGTTEGLDTQLFLKNPNSFQIAAVDDIGEPAPEGLLPTDAVIEVTLELNGFYTIQATRFGGRGEYALTLELVTE